MALLPLLARAFDSCPGRRPVQYAGDSFILDSRFCFVGTTVPTVSTVPTVPTVHTVNYCPCVSCIGCFCCAFEGNIAAPAKGTQDVVLQGVPNE